MIYLGKGDWTPDLQYHTAYSKNQLVAIVYRLTDLVKEFAIRRKSGNIYDKYESQEFFRVIRPCLDKLQRVLKANFEILRFHPARGLIQNFESSLERAKNEISYYQAIELSEKLLVTRAVMS